MDLLRLERQDCFVGPLVQVEGAAPGFTDEADNGQMLALFVVGRPAQLLALP